MHPAYSDSYDSIHKAKKNKNAQPVIWIGDFNNFDDAVALMLMAKDPRYKLELVVVEESYNSVAHGVNTVYNILEWLGNLNVSVIRGAYHSVEEVKFGANGESAVGTKVLDEHSIPGVPDYQIPNSSDFTTGTWNLERRNVMGINLYGQFVPGPWRDNGATLYATEHLLPDAQQKNYHFQGNQGRAFKFKLAENIILDKLTALNKKAVLINTGKMTTLARVLAKAKSSQFKKIKKSVIMGGGFQGLKPFTAEYPAACYGNKSRNLGGNIFSHHSFNCESDFSTHQEFNIFLDPVAASQSFDLLSINKVPTYLIPTNATDLAKIKMSSITRLAEKNATPESCYVSRLFSNIRDFEGGDFNGNGDFALDSVIRLWDIMAALALLEPKLIQETEKAYVEVEQLNPGLQNSSTPYDPITFDPMVGKTSLHNTGTGMKINVVLQMNVEAARNSMIKRLRKNYNSAVEGPECD